MNPKILISLTITCILTGNVNSQNANLIVGSGAVINGGANAFVVLPGDIRVDGLVNGDLNSTWNFAGAASQQRITCIAGTGCTNIYNIDNYLVRFGNIEQRSTGGLSIEQNTIVKKVHTFINGATEIKEGTLWLDRNIATKYSGVDAATGKFFTTTGHGLLKQSNVGSSAVTFPIGVTSATNEYTPVSITYSGTADTFGLRVYNNVYYSYNTANGDAAGGTSNYRFVQKTWVMKKSTRFTGDQVTVTPQWNLDDENSAFTPRRPTDIVIARNHDGFWIPEAIQGPATPPTGSGPFSYTGVVTYDNAPWEYYPFSVTAINTVLPLTGLVFTGEMSGKDALLKWSTLTETNSNYFELQRSINGSDFTYVSKIAAAGNSTAKLTYSYRDAALPAVKSIYYRLKCVDKDGRYTYSNIVLVEKNEAASKTLVYPIPARDFVNIYFWENTGNATIRIIDVHGRTVMQVKRSIAAGYTERVNITRLSAAPYFINVIPDNNPTHVSVYKFNVVR